MNNDLVKFTDGDLNSPLSPVYHASFRLAESITEKFNIEHLKPIVDKAADEFRDKLWTDITDHLLSDTEYNIANSVIYMVEQTVTALLTGNEWAMNNYPYANYTKGEEIRKAVAAHGSERLLMDRIKDLEEKLERAQETIDWLRK